MDDKPNFRIDAILDGGLPCPVAWFVVKQHAEEFKDLLDDRKARNTTYQVNEVSKCESHNCSYYQHYLVVYMPEANGSKMAHEEFHQAEVECISAQNRVEEWYKAHETDSKPCPRSIEQRAEFWERRIAA